MNNLLKVEKKNTLDKIIEIDNKMKSNNKENLEILKLKLYINKYLPYELIEFIKGLTYKKQPKNVLYDLKHYYKTNKMVRDNYIYNNIRNYIFQRDVNDLSMIQNNILYYGVSNIYSIFSRLIIKPNKKKIKNFIFNEDSISTHEYNLRKFNTYWGLFNIKEREKFIELIKDLNY